ncbi:MAG: sigma-70 family RNA polymerase sigma factor [Edaphobacter sp.]
MIPFRHKSGKSLDFEALFFAYYEQLIEWALQLTQRAHADAEDLVHDLYIYRARSKAQPENIEKLDAYLFTILRNLHYSRLRRAGRSPIDDLSIVDFDSIERGLASVDRRKLLDVRTNLRSICEYICERKNTARSASLFILRFFFGYYPSELEKITCTNRTSVRVALSSARQEAKLYLQRPNVLRSILPQQAVTLFPGISDTSHKLFLELRRAIFSTCIGPCIGQEELARRYQVESKTGFTVTELAHLASCPVCLDQANTIFGLPLLADRSPDETLGRDNSQGPDGRPQGPVEVPSTRAKKASKTARARQKIERRLSELFEHRPTSLEIVIDGDVRTSQKVTAEVSELHLKLAHKEEPSFIEIMSEQGFCMAFLQVEPPIAARDLEQVETALFSDDRSLVLSLSFAAEGPIVHVLYRDPVMAQAVAGSSDARDAADAVPTETTSSLLKPIPRSPIVSSRSRFRFWTGQLIAWLAGHGKDLLVLSRNPLLVGGVAIAVAVCVWLWPSKSPSMSAIMLLQHAEVSESVPLSASKPEVIYEKVRIKTAKRSIEWSIYRDTSGRRKQKQQPVDPQTTELETRLAGAGVNWSEPLSAATYQDWRDHVQVTGDMVRETGNNLLTLTTTVSDAEVTQESLTVRESDFHPVARTISFRDTGTVEIAELDYKVLPWNAESETWFEPSVLPSNEVVPARPSLRLPASMALSESQLDEAELSVRLTLNHLHADTGEQIEVARGLSGIEVRGIAATEERKHQLEAQLHMLPHVTASISSIEELKAKPSQTGGPTSAEVIEMQTQRTPLQSYYLAHGRNTTSLGDLSQRLYDSAFAVSQESRAIEDLEHRFSRNADISTVASAALTELMFTHKHKLLEALEEEQQLLNSAQIEAAPGDQDVSTKSTDLLLASLAERNRAVTWDLAVGKGGEGRSAEALASELATSINALQIRAHQVHIGPQDSMRADKRR